MTTTRILDYFTSLVAEDDSLPLTEAALSLAQDAYPDLDLQGVLAEIDDLSCVCAVVCPMRPISSKKSAC
jgi:regulator of sirC expression with transglutaminase-like and TPR domain